MKKQKTEDAVPFEKTEGEISEQKQGRRSCRLKTILRLIQRKRSEKTTCADPPGQIPKTRRSQGPNEEKKDENLFSVCDRRRRVGVSDRM